MLPHLLELEAVDDHRRLAAPGPHYVRLYAPSTELGASGPGFGLSLSEKLRAGQGRPAGLAPRGVPGPEFLRHAEDMPD